MARNRSRVLTIHELAGLKSSSRRDFLKKVSLGGGTIILSNRYLVRGLFAQTEAKKTVFSMVVVDFNKCTGCRTCETVCSSSNHMKLVDGKELPDLGNPALSNIRVHSYNPDVDIPVTCLMCDDAPCLEACPVDPDPKTGRKAIYREAGRPVLHNDLERCIGCGSCSEACRTKRAGVIIPNPQTHKPERMCTLCNGDPQCVKNCPFQALSYVVEGMKGKYYGTSPDEVAKTLTTLWYGRDEEAGRNGR
jgi:anaerobic carbon-monoxide dehydrogenase iron sulfur subunit